MTNNNVDWIQTHSGKSFNFLNPSIYDISISDIAYGLSSESRFAGQSVRSRKGYVYNVATHSLWASLLGQRYYNLDPKTCLCLLLHDSAEAYIKDIPSPIKKHLIGYDKLEFNLLSIIFETYGLSDCLPFSPIVKEIDARMLATEKRDVMGDCSVEWSPEYTKYQPTQFKVKPVSPEKSRKQFLRRFLNLQKEIRNTRIK